MTMLSRVAERLFWAARYLERAEDSSRLVNSYFHVVLDLPIGAALGWDVLLKITANEEQFGLRYNKPIERNVVKFLIADDDNPASILSSVRELRENVRTTRDVIPADVWEQVNELHHRVQDEAVNSVARRARYGFLTDVVESCQRINGALEGTLSRDQAYYLLQIGRNLERADMCTRILDVAAGILLERSADISPCDSLLWANILKTLGAGTAYLRRVGPTIQADEVISLILGDETFPRSVLHCLGRIRLSARRLPRPRRVILAAAATQRNLLGLKIEATKAKRLHGYLDELQQELIQIQDRATKTWF